MGGSHLVMTLEVGPSSVFSYSARVCVVHVRDHGVDLKLPNDGFPIHTDGENFANTGTDRLVFK